jgi:hypothetical protein
MEGIDVDVRVGDHGHAFILPAAAYFANHRVVAALL